MNGNGRGVEEIPELLGRVLARHAVRA
jgi:hypothetical protein